MKIIVLGNQARALSNFWSVLIRQLRQGGHEALCCVPPGDPEALAGAMESFILAPGTIARMGEAGRELAVREFDAEKVAARILRDMHVPAGA